MATKEQVRYYEAMAQIVEEETAAARSLLDLARDGDELRSAQEALVVLGVDPKVIASASADPAIGHPSL